MALRSNASRAIRLQEWAVGRSVVLESGDAVEARLLREDGVHESGRQGLMTSGNLNTVPAMGSTTSTCCCFPRGSRSK